jgi:hypothetical protein
MTRDPRYAAGPRVAPTATPPARILRDVSLARERGRQIETDLGLAQTHSPDTFDIVYPLVIGALLIMTLIIVGAVQIGRFLYAHPGVYSIPAIAIAARPRHQRHPQAAAAVMKKLPATPEERRDRTVTALLFAAGVAGLGAFIASLKWLRIGELRFDQAIRDEAPAGTR